MVALIMSSVAVYVTANTYLQAGVEFVDRRPGYSVLISRAPWSDAWIAGIMRWYILLLCLLSLVHTILGLVVLQKVRRSFDFAGRVDQDADGC